VAVALAAPAVALAAGSVLALGEAGSSGITAVDCATGRSLAAVQLPAPLAAPVVAEPSRRALYAVTRGGELLRYALPGLVLEARSPLGLTPRVVAAAPGPEGFVLVGGDGAQPLSARDPGTLAELHRYRAPEGAGAATTTAILTIPGRQRFVVGFAELPVGWEIAWNRDAPEVMLGLVHDYRMGEALPLPGRITPRPLKFGSPTRAIADGPASYEVARIDTAGRFGVVNLDVRREIERPALDAPGEATRTAPWRDAAGQGWLVAAPAAAALSVLDAASWRVTGRIDLPGEVLSVAPAPGPGQALVAHRTADGGVAVARVDARKMLIRPVSSVPAGAQAPLRFVADDAGCTALVDAQGRWLAADPPGDAGFRR